MSIGSTKPKGAIGRRRGAGFGWAIAGPTGSAGATGSVGTTGSAGAAGAAGAGGTFTGRSLSWSFSNRVESPIAIPPGTVVSIAGIGATATGPAFGAVG